CIPLGCLGLRRVWLPIRLPLARQQLTDAVATAGLRRRIERAQYDCSRGQRQGHNGSLRRGHHRRTSTYNANGTKFERDREYTVASETSRLLRGARIARSVRGKPACVSLHGSSTSARTVSRLARRWPPVSCFGAGSGWQREMVS